jgi:signal transduction histidine kinase
MYATGKSKSNKTNKKRTEYLEIGNIMKFVRGKFLKSPASLALLLLLMTVLVFSAGGWYVFELVRQSKEKDLEPRLLGIGQTAAAVFLNGKNFYLLEQAVSLENFEEDTLEELPSLKQSLKDLVMQNSLRNAMILDRDANVLSDALNKFTPGEDYSFFILDEIEIDKSFSGIPSVSILYYVEDIPYIRAYIPLKNTAGEVTAILQIEAGQNSFQDIYRIRYAMYWLGIIIILLLTLVAVLFYRLLKSLLRTEETLALADRLQSLGAMAAGLAHEIRNPLSIIRVTAESVAEEIPEDAEQQPLLASIVDETDRLNQLITQLLQFTKPAGKKERSAHCDVKKALQATLTIIKKDLEKKSIKVSISIEENLQPARIDEKSLRQVLLNLVLNAREAIGKDGEIVINISSAKNKCIIEITDSGSGISKNRITRIFDPFFTTKDSGTGLGLFVSRMLVERAGGTLDIKSRGKKGCIARIEVETLHATSE